VGPPLFLRKVFELNSLGLDCRFGLLDWHSEVAGVSACIKGWF
jgi:hypothetical protein